MNNRLDIQILKDTINDLKNNPNACTTYVGATADDGSFVIPESYPGEQLKKFIKYFYENNLIDYQYVENYEKFKEKKIEDYTYEETLTALTSIIRGDRFVSAYLYSCVKDGTLLKLVEKLMSLTVDSFNDQPANIVNDVARIMNYRLHAEQLFIPILNDFQIENDNNPQTILLASGHGFTEQLTSDGYIKDGEFKQRIELVINNTKQFMKNNGCENVDNSFMYYKNYNNGVFEFELYVSDMIIPVGTEKKIIRQFNAYFVEPIMHDFYQLSLSAGPFTMPTEMLKIGKIDLNNDNITISLDNLMKNLMDNLKYKNMSKKIEDGNLIFECNRYNSGLHTSFDWERMNYRIFSDGTIEITEYYGDSNQPMHGQVQTKKMDSIKLENFISIINNLENNDVFLDACDGETWDMFKYDKDHKIIWKRDLGYIYGNEKLEKIVNLILS